MEDDNLVEAIEEGRIVKVSEFYAREEGLPIIRKPSLDKIHEAHSQLAPSTSTHIEQEKKLKDYSQHHTNWKDKQVISELVDNWHWVIRMERKKKALTRKQLARIVNETEDNLKLIESGVLPKKDFVLINKIQQALRINIRKDKRDFSQSITDIYPKRQTKPWLARPNSSDEIEILDDEI